jgi:hypothetical protein
MFHARGKGAYAEGAAARWVIHTVHSKRVTSRLAPEVDTFERRTGNRRLQVRDEADVVERQQVERMVH